MNKLYKAQHKQARKEGEKMNKTGKKYGLVTAISMVVGSVIGSGIFFKAESISRITGGNALAGICGWVIGGIIMLCCLLMFARLSSKYNSSCKLIYSL